MVADEPEPVRDDQAVIDFEEDPVEIQTMAQNEEDSSAFYSDDPGRRIDNADLDNLLDEFVDVVNGRDFDTLADLLEEDAQADFLGEGSRDGVVSAMNDLILRNPTLITTRGDLGSDPIVAVWAYDREAGGFDPFGFILLELSDSEEGLISRIEYVEELGESDDLVLELPERSELPEWWDWSELDED
jgi:hypothetical protein